MDATAAATAADNNVRVFCRIRPQNDREAGQTSVLRTDGPAVIASGGVDGAGRVFTYDHVFDTASTQEEVFRIVGMPITASCLQGYNGTIFAYGQTGSGKTHTVTGPSRFDADDATASAQRGLLPRVLEYIFARTRATATTAVGAESTIKYLCKASYLEIYNEKVYDLLETASTDIREDMRDGVYVEDLTEEVVNSVEEATAVMQKGVVNRHVGSTAMNRESSRSHSVFTLTIESQETVDDLTKSRRARFHLIDLAGSERQKSTQADGVRLKEAGSINRSLSALGNVIHSLADLEAGRQRHVHYRDSKLTFLLRDSLGGNSKTYVVATVTAALDSFEETLSTLKFASSAKKIKNNARINENTFGTVVRLQAEVLQLRNEIAELRASGAVGHPSRVLPDAAAFEDAPEDEDSSTNSEQVTQIHQLYIQLQQNTSELQAALAEEKAQSQQYQSTIKALENKVQQSNMMVKFRDSEIARLRSKTDATPERIAGLEAELAALKDQDRQNPEVLRLATKVNTLQQRLDRIQAGKEIVNDVEGFMTRYRNMEAEASCLRAQLACAFRIVETLKAQAAAAVQTPAKVARTPAPTPGRVAADRYWAEEEKKYQQALEDSRAAMHEQTRASERELKRLNEALATAHAQLERIKSDSEAKAQLLAFKDRELEEATQTARSMELRLDLLAAEKQRSIELLEQKLETSSNKQLERAAKELQLQAEVEAKLAQVSQQNQSLQAAFKDLQAAHESMKKMLQDSEARVNALTVERDAWNAELEQTNAQLKERHLIISELKATNATLSSSVAQFSSSNMEQASTIANLTQRLEEAAKEAEAAEFALDNLNEDLDSVCQQNRAYAQELRTKEECIAQAQQSLAATTATIAQLQQQLEVATTGDAQAKQDAKQLRECILGLEQRLLAQQSLLEAGATREVGLQSQIAEHSNTIAQLGDAVQDLTRKLADAKVDLSAAVADSENAAKRIEELEDDSRQLNEDLARMESASNAAQQELIAELTRKKEELDSIKSAASALREQLESRIVALESALATSKHDAEQLSSTVMCLETALSSERDAGAAMKLELQAAVAEAAAKQVQVLQLSEHVSELESALRIQGEVHASVKLELQVAVGEAVAKQAQVVQLSERVAELDSALHTESEAHAAVELELQVAVADVNAKQGQMEQLTHRVAELESALHTESEAHAAVTLELQAAVADVNDKQGQMAQLTHRVAQLESEANQTATALTDAVAQVTLLKAELEQSTIRQNEMRTGMEVAVADLSASEGRAAALADKLSATESQLEAVNQRASELEEQVSEAQTQYNLLASAMENAETLEAELRHELVVAQERAQSAALEAAEHKLRAETIADELAGVHASEQTLQEIIDQQKSQLDKLHHQLDSERKSTAEWSEAKHHLETALLDKQIESERLASRLKAAEVAAREAEEEVARISGHQNEKQKINRMLEMKREYSELREKYNELLEQNFALRKRHAKLERHGGPLSKENLPPMGMEDM